MAAHLTLPSQQRNPTTVACKLSTQLISKVAGISRTHRYDDVRRLDLHMREQDQGEIVLIENLEICPNLKLLNLSYNSIQVLGSAEFCTFARLQSNSAYLKHELCQSLLDCILL